MRRAALLVTLATAAEARAQPVDNSALECAPSGPTYWPRGHHFAVTPGAQGPEPIYYRQSDQGSDDIPGSFAEADAIQRAFLTWMLVDCGGGVLPNVWLEDGFAANGNQDYPGPGPGPDTVSVVWFQESGWGADSNTVALTTYYYHEDTGWAASADMKFNGQEYRWRAKETTNWNTDPPTVGPFQGCSASSKCYDVESVALHEVGHFLGFNHVMCADAVMFPHGSGTQLRVALSTHEATGVCKVYPVRPASVPTTRYFGESCTQDNQCPDTMCIKGNGGAAPSGYCTMACANDGSCPEAWVCAPAQRNTGRRFCMPGPHATGGATGGGGCSCNSSSTCQSGCSCDPDCSSSGGTDSTDLCRPCTDAEQCQNGLCANDGTSSICTQACNANFPCPSGYQCVNAGTVDVCWPLEGTPCNAGAGDPELNEICYRENTQNPRNSFFAPCAAGLLCFGFQPRCGGQTGACVTYCSADGDACAEGLTCCYGLDGNGNCLRTPPTGTAHGGCFNLRRIGESCFLAENSVCEAGSNCFDMGDGSGPRCFQTCAGASCNSDTTCIEASDGCFNNFAVCCDSKELDPDGDGTPNVCSPGEADTLYELGVRCNDNSECDSNLCLRYDGGAACSRVCNPVTGQGCPGDDFDANDDGTPDGGFVCRLIGSGAEPGRCWPRNGPIEPPASEEDTLPPPGGCCESSALGAGDWLLGAAVWLPMVLAWRRRRRG